MDWTMGAWVKITSVGDGELWIGLNGPDVTGAMVNLEPGWNLVGYPSTVTQLASDTLPAEVTKMGVRDEAQPYDVKEVQQPQFNTVLMEEGNAYWLYATSACVWSLP